MCKKNIIIIGADGLLGSHFYKFYNQKFYEIQCTHYKKTKDYIELNLADLDIDNLCFNKQEYDFAIIAAGIKKLDLCENQKEYTYKVNVSNTLKLVKYFDALNIKPVVFSSETVFDGKDTIYNEDSITKPLHEYGRQKECLEMQIPKICKNEFLIIRASRIMSTNSRDHTFLNTLINKVLNKKKVKIFYDQVFFPIFVEEFVEIAAALIEKNCSGLFNVCGKEPFTHLKLMKSLSKYLAFDMNLLEPVSMDIFNGNYLLPRKINLSRQKLDNVISLSKNTLENYFERLANSYQKNPLQDEVLPI